MYTMVEDASKKFLVKDLQETNVDELNEELKTKNTRVKMEFVSKATISSKTVS